MTAIKVKKSSIAERRLENRRRHWDSMNILKQRASTRPGSRNPRK